MSTNGWVSETCREITTCWGLLNTTTISCYGWLQICCPYLCPSFHSISEEKNIIILLSNTESLSLLFVSFSSMKKRWELCWNHEFSRWIPLTAQKKIKFIECWHEHSYWILTQKTISEINQIEKISKYSDLIESNSLPKFCQFPSEY